MNLDAALKPYLEMIDSINESSSKLEAIAYMMDAYSKRLGRFQFIQFSLFLYYYVYVKM